MKIRFVAQNEVVNSAIDKPEPAVKLMPDWWKKMSRYAEVNKPWATVKACAPTLDIMSAGYIVKLWFDMIVVEREGGEIDIEIPGVANYATLISSWSPKQVAGLPVPDGYHPHVFKFHHGWTIKTPKGWSCMFIQPIGHFDLVTQPVAGLVDTDILKTDVNVPFYIKKGFTGLIPKGTPMFQVIPMKRAPWVMDTVGGLDNYIEYEREHVKLFTVFTGWYSKRRERKSYK